MVRQYVRGLEEVILEIDWCANMPLKVLNIVAKLAEGGGIAEAVVGFASAINGRQLAACDVLTCWENGLTPFVARCMENDVAVHTVKMGWQHTIWYSKEWLLRLDQIAHSYDVLHIHGLWLYPNLISAYWCIRQRKPFAISPHGGLLPCALAQSRWKKRVIMPLARQLFSKAACVHVASDMEAASVQRFFGKRTPPMACVVEGVDVREVAKCESWRHEVRGQRSEAGERSSRVRECESSKVGGSGTVGNRQSAIGNGENARKDAKTLSELEPAPVGAMDPLNLETSAQRDGTFESLRLRTMLYLGRVSPEKNLHVLVDAWKRLDVETKKNWVLHLIGFPEKGGSRYADMLAERCSHISDVQTEAFCDADRKWRVLLESDVLVLPSLTENFGIVVAEALACGIPVITTKGAPWEELLGDQACLAKWRDSGVAEWQDSRDPAREESSTCPAKLATHAIPANLATLASPAITANGRCGWWIDVGVEPLVAALREAMRLTDEERHEMGTNGRNLVESKYRWETVAGRMAEVYERCVDAGMEPKLKRQAIGKDERCRN